MAEQQPVLWRRAAGYYTWRALTAGVIVLVLGWDGITLTLMPDGYASDSYDVLRQIAPWGMVTYGPPLLALFLITLYAYGRHRGGAGRSYVLLRICLGVTAVWYTGWTFGIIGSWFTTEHISSLGVGKLLLLAMLCIALARLTPTSQPPGR